MIIKYMKGRVGELYDSALLSFTLYLFKIYTERHAKTASTKWTSVEETNKKILNSAIKILEHAKNNK